MEDSNQFTTGETHRLDTLRSLGLLDTPDEKDFDDIAALAAQICDVPIALISLVDQDRQYFKARVGIDGSETPISQSVCAFTMTNGGILEIPDTEVDARTANNPLVCDGVVDMKFYAGTPLVTSDGVPLGALCVLDRTPRVLTQEQRNALQVLGRQVMTQIELRRALRESDDAARRLADALDRQEILRREIDHRVKNSLLQVTSLLRLQARRSDDAKVKAALEEAEHRIGAIAAVHAELHRAGSVENVNMADYLERLTGQLRHTIGETIKLEWQSDAIVLRTEIATALAIVINEFVANSAKYAFPNGGGTISIGLEKIADQIVATMTDDGVGMDISASERSTGLGMLVMRASAAQIDGTLTFETAARGTSIKVVLPG